MQLFKSAVLVAVLLISTAISAQNVHPDYHDGKLYVKLNNAIQIPSVNGVVEWESFDLLQPSALRQFGVSQVTQPFYHTRSLDLQQTLEIDFTELNKTYQLVEWLNNLVAVDYAELFPLNKKSFIPNDLGPVSGSLNSWHLYKTQADSAWDYSQGSSNIVVAIVDDAVEISHSDLTNSLWTNPGEVPNDNIDNDGNGYVDDVFGADVTTGNTNNPSPPNANFDHGTHVAGISGATTNNGIGIASIGFSIRLMSIKASSSSQFINGGYTGITYAVDNGAHIINCSWGGGGFSNTARNVTDYAWENGAIVVAAAGNDDASTLQYPAAYPNVVAVASSDPDDSRSWFTNYGSWVTVTAPGNNIWSCDLNNGYRSAGGTSMASPFVAGLLGLMKSFAPSLANADLIDCLTSTCDNIDSQNSSFVGLLGAGRVNAYSAMKCLNTKISAPPTPRITSSKNQVCPGDTVEFTGFSTAGAINTYNWFFQGGTPQNSFDPNPKVVYNGPGQFNVQLTLGNQFGTNTLVENDLIKLDTNSLEQVFFEDFEGNITAKGWQIDNPDNLNTWLALTVNGARNGTRAMVMSLFNYTNIGQKDALITPMLDLTQTSKYKLRFDHAYRSLNPGSSDSLVIWVSIDGGLTFPYRVFSIGEDGNGSFETSSASTTNFIPLGGQDWCFSSANTKGCVEVDLSQFAGKNGVKIKFESVNANGNNMFIDNVEVLGNCYVIPLSVNEVSSGRNLQLYPNPATNELTLESSSNILEYSIIDLTGKILHQENRLSRDLIQVRLDDLTSGVYVIQVQTADGKRSAHRFVLR